MSGGETREIGSGGGGEEEKTCVDVLSIFMPQTVFGQSIPVFRLAMELS